MPLTVRAYTSLAASMVLAGSTIPVAKLLITDLPIFALSTLRFAGAAAILFLMLRRNGPVKPISGREQRLILLQSLFGSFLFSLLLMNGLRLTTAAAGGLITSLTPVVTGLLAILFLGERLRVNLLFSLLLAVAGVGLLNLAGLADADSGAPSLPGNLLVVGAVVAEAIFVVLGKRSTSRAEPLAVAARVCLYGMLVFLLPGIYQSLQMDWRAVSAAEWLVILYYAAMGTAGAYLLWFWGLAHVQASRAGIFTGLMPVSALVIAVPLLGETVTWVHGIGGLLVLSALGLVARSGG